MILPFIVLLLLVSLAVAGSEVDIALELRGVLDNAGVSVNVGPGVSGDVDLPGARIQVGPSTPRLPPDDPARVLLERVGEQGIRDTLRLISAEDRAELLKKCEDILREYGARLDSGTGEVPAIVLICQIVKSEG